MIIQALNVHDQISHNKGFPKANYESGVKQAKIIKGCIYGTASSQAPNTLWLMVIGSYSASQMVLTVKNLPVKVGDIRNPRVWSLGQEDPLEEGIPIHSSILVWRIPWTEEPGRLQFIGSQQSDITEATACTPSARKRLNRKGSWTQGMDLTLYDCCLSVCDKQWLKTLHFYTQEVSKYHEVNIIS